MSNELERRLQAAFERLPTPTADASSRARAAAVATVAPSRSRSRGTLAVAALAFTFVVSAAAALAASGKLAIRLGERAKATRPVPTRLAVPSGTSGIAVVAGGHVWLATKGGLRIEALPVSTAELSPHALYAVVGIGSSLIALAPGNHRAWVERTDGRVVSASWSPDGLKIAYVVARRGGDELRMIEGDGSPDRLLAAAVRPAKPSWRRDSLAVAYVDRKGRPAVFDLGTDSIRTFDTRSCGGGARQVVYDRTAPALAVVSPRGVAVVRRWDRPPACMPTRPSRPPNVVGWLAGGRLVDSAAVGGAVTSLAVGPSGSAIAVAVPRPGGLQLGLVREDAARPIRPTWLVRLRARPTAVSISWR
jgi:hypothetical protein